MNSKNNRDDVVEVSVLCITYNHEDYIRQCMEGFLMQKTNFSFEILVHDDASKDGTGEILREYERKYPTKITAVCQEKNQFSQGVNITLDILLPKARGRYIAFCEGDDYWTDPLKLQKQFDVMEKNPDCRLCLHSALWVSKEGEPLGKTCPSVVPPSGKYASQDFTEFLLLEYALRFFPHINSCFFRTNDMREYAKQKPEFYKHCKKAGFGDEPLILYLSQLGPTYFFSEAFSVYRPWSTPTSASLRKLDMEETQRYFSSICDFVNAYDEFTKYSFHEICLLYKKALLLKCSVKTKNYKKCVQHENRKLLKKIVPSIRWRAKIYLGAYFPKLIHWYDAKKERS